ncbi:MAG: hypothetical protein ACT4QC_17610 [Planctomycetaceae bacterium]
MAQEPAARPEAVGGNPTDPHREWIDPPYPRSDLIAGIEFDLSSRKTLALGSDIWPITWADDDHQYAPFGDGAGFGVESRLESGDPAHRVSLGVARIEDGHDDYLGINVWGGKNAENPAQFIGKGTGIIAVNGVLYMWVAGPGSATVPETRLAVSHDHSRTWRLVDWHWTMQDRLFAGVFVNFGRDNQGARDEYVYACFSRIENPPPQHEKRRWIHETPGRVDLARALKSRLVDQTAWEWLAGLDDTGKPQWTFDLRKRRHTFEDPNGIKIVSVCRHAQLGRYLLVYNPRDNAGHFALFESPELWGPWRQVAYLRGVAPFMPPEPNTRISVFHFAPKWWSADGREFTLVFNTGDDAWNTMRGRLLSQ